MTSKLMRRLLYQFHRWLGIAIAPLVLLWFISGLVMLYAPPSTLTQAQRLAHEVPLNIGSNWLTLREAWQQHNGADASSAVATIATATLVRQAGTPWWLVTNRHSQHFRISAIDGTSHAVTPQSALVIARTWAGQRGKRANFVATVAGDSGTRMGKYNPYRPFQEIALHDHAGTELLISARTGQVIRATTRIDRALTLAGAWLHFLRPLDSIGLKSIRRPLLTWGVFAAFLTVLFGLIIGWLRWRPGWFGRRRYSRGRVHPYRRFWSRWHFWLGLLGGILALGWTLSGFLAAEPWHWFSSPHLTVKDETHYLGASPPAEMLDWQPAPVHGAAQAVELTWSHIGASATLLAYDRTGQRHLIAHLARNKTLPNETHTAFATETLLLASRRLLHGLPIHSYAYQRNYDAYYYPTHRHDIADRPLPVLRIGFSDTGQTQLYIDPLDGHVVARIDRSRQIYRWLFNALHTWDFGWLYRRPLWDVWMLPWLLLGIALSVSAIVIGWKRLGRKRVFKPKMTTAHLPD